MSQGAHVRSIEALRELRGALAMYQEEAGAALSMAEADIVRTIGWIRSSQIPHWKKEIIRRQELLTRAKSDLARAQITNHAMGPKSTVDERKAINRAKAKLKEAEDKLDSCKRWFRELEKQYTLYKGRVAPMQRTVAAELPRARDELELMARTLDDYLAINMGGSSDAGAPGQAAGRTGPVVQDGASSAPTRRVWKELAPSRRLRSRAPFADDPQEALHAAARAESWGLLDQDSTRRIASMLGAEGALEIRVFDAPAFSRKLGPLAEVPPSQDRLLIASDWTPDAPTLLLRSLQPPLGDSGWLIARSDLRETPADPVAVRIEDAVGAFPELAIVLAVPRGVALLVREAELIAIQDERGRPLSAFDADILHDEAED